MQTVPARVRSGFSGRRSGIAFIILLSAVVIPLSYFLIADKHAADVPGYKPATATLIREQGADVAAQPPLSLLPAGQMESVADDKRSIPPEISAIGNGQLPQSDRPGSAVPAGGSPSASYGAQPLAQADQTEDMANGDSAPGGRSLEAAASLADEVLHITNVGDRIVVSRGPDGQYAAAAPETTSQSAVSAISPRATSEPTGGGLDPDGSQAQRPDYEDVYPGCPRVLPQGADEQMALERQQLYGCLYNQSCGLSEDGETPYCTWYLIKKL